MCREEFKEAIKEYKKSIFYKKEFNVTFAIDDWSSIYHSYISIAFAYLVSGKNKSAEKNLAKLSKMSSSLKDIGILKSYIQKRLVDKKSIYQLMELCDDLRKTNPESHYLLWMEKDLARLKDSL